MTTSPTDVVLLDPAPEAVRTNVRVFPSADALDPVLKEALAHLAPVRFTSCADSRECGRGEAIINLSGDHEVIAALLRAGASSFNIPAGVQQLPSGGEDRPIQFGDSAHLDGRLRGRCLWHTALPDRFALKVEPGDEVLAERGGKPDWLLRKNHDGQAHIVSMPLPKLQPGDLPARYLSGGSFISLLPLVHFLREFTADSRWKRPPVMACMIIDDPNLHWISYGFLGFENMLARVKSVGAHVAFATIPLDAWGFHPKTVRLFRDHQRDFSLLYHGNDHTKWELAQDRTPDSWLGVFAQGMTRIARLEERTGLPVARVMVPPHEGYSDAALLALSILGFEGACFPLAKDSRSRAGQQVRAAFGLEMAEWMGGRLPVLQRFNMASASCQGQIIISAFLNRPIIPVGHQDTFADGYEALDRAIATINSLGEVRWAGPSTMLNRSYCTFQEKSSLWIKPYARRVQLTVPADVTKVGAILPPDLDASVTLDVTARNTDGAVVRRVCPSAGEPVEVRPGQTLDVRLVTPDFVDYRQIKRPGLSYRALVRRVLCEGRDRLSPFLGKLVTHKTK
jgi:hypothetical protein